MHFVAVVIPPAFLLFYLPDVLQAIIALAEYAGVRRGRKPVPKPKKMRT